MKKGGTERKHLGFTIVETMIVLAVSAMLFVIAATMISGRQSKTEFQVGARDVQTKIQQVINETKSGYYGAEGITSCSVSGTGKLNITTGSGSLGTRGDCLFIGKALVATNDTIYIYPLVGARRVFGSDVAPTNAGDARAMTVSAIASTYRLPYGMRVVGTATGSATITNGANTIPFAILTSFDGSGEGSSGSQTFDLHAFNTAGSFAPGSTMDQFATYINAEVPNNPPRSGAYPSTQRIALCIQSGGTNQSLIITIGADMTGGTAVSSQIKTGTTCGA